MSVRDAMQFIARVRREETIKTQLRGLGIDPDLDQVVAIGSAMGLHFSADELRNAYGYEWTMRSLYLGFQKKHAG